MKQLKPQLARGDKKLFKRWRQINSHVILCCFGTRCHHLRLPTYTSENHRQLSQSFFLLASFFFSMWWGWVPSSLWLLLWVLSGPWSHYFVSHDMVTTVGRVQRYWWLDSWQMVPLTTGILTLFQGLFLVNPHKTGEKGLIMMLISQQEKRTGKFPKQSWN